MNIPCPVLVLGDFSNYVYHPFDGVAVHLKTCLAAQGFVVKCSEDRNELVREKIREYRLVISYTDVWEKHLDPEPLQGLLDFISAGGGFLAIHSGIGYQNPELKNLLGASFTGHPPCQSFSLTVKDKNHPITNGISGFTLEDELYMFDFVPERSPRIIMESWLDGKNYPSAWTDTYHRGRIVYLAPGHSAASFQNEMFQKLIANSALWAAGEVGQGG